MRREKAHAWVFRPRFRRGAFGWRSQPAIKRIKEAVSEIKKVARKDPILAADGAVVFLEKLSPAIEQVDSSSGAIGTAVNNAIAVLVPVISGASADDKLHDKWMARLWDALLDDEMPYIELLADYWGELCVSTQRSSKWADDFLPTVNELWGTDAKSGYFKGTSACFSALWKAGRYKEILELLDRAPHKFWHYRKWGVRALADMGRKSEAIHYAERSRGLNESPIEIALACEEILLSSGLADEAYRRYAIEANQKPTYSATFRAIAKKYPAKNARQILDDLVASTPGSEGKWFAPAKSAGLLDQAIKLANRSPCDPKTLTRAARDMAQADPKFAIEVGIAALKWLSRGYGYEITGADVISAYHYMLEAAKNAGSTAEAVRRINDLLSTENLADSFVFEILGPKLKADHREAK